MLHNKVGYNLAFHGFDSVSTHFGPLSRLSKEGLLKTNELDGRIYFEGLLTSLQHESLEESQT
jgi:hypothetical protein